MPECKHKAHCAANASGECTGGDCEYKLKELDLVAELMGLAERASCSNRIDSLANDSQRIKVVVALKLAAQAVEWLKAAGVE